MNILKKLLRGIYYFCVGVKSSCCDFYEWYIDNRSIPGFLRNKVALIRDGPCDRRCGMGACSGDWQRFER